MDKVKSEQQQKDLDEIEGLIDQFEEYWQLINEVRLKLVRRQSNYEYNYHERPPEAMHQ